MDTCQPAMALRISNAFGGFESELRRHERRQKPNSESMIMELTDSPSSFLLPGIRHEDLLAGAFTGSGDAEHDQALKFLHGTTTLGFVFSGGIIIAVDSRASMGSYVGSQTVKKCIEITPYLLGTMAGGAADCQYWERHLGRLCRLYELRNKERISVAAASKLLHNIMYSYKGYGLSMGTMIAGWDKGLGPSLYYCDSEGTRVQGQKFSVGSGSPYAWGVLDEGFKHEMGIEEACELGRRAIYHATFRDAYSGGRVSVFHVHEEGWTKISMDDVEGLHWKYEAEVRQGNAI
uniref:Proteasome subunit beta n=1 Tax=Cryptomonas curvata TaxID=233186 RepID=A0A7S0QCX3_9CRYP